MQEFDITPVLSHPEMMHEIETEAVGRVEQQLEDFRAGNKRASNSYGKPSTIEKRNMETRLLHSRIGCMAESIGSKVTKCEWPKQRKQYNNGSRQPDLLPIFRGNKTPFAVRGTGEIDKVIFRCYEPGKGKDFWTDPNMILFGVANLPLGPHSLIGYLDFGTAQELCKSHPDWYVPDTEKGNPYYWIPIDRFYFDENDFTPTTKR